MKPPGKNFKEINELIELAIEASISPAQSQRLNDWIINDPAIRRHYCEYIQLTVCMERLSAAITPMDLPEYDMIFDQELWNQLAREEKTAPELEIPQKQSQHELIQKVIYPPREKRKLSKFSIFMLLNAAAIILFFLFLRFASPTSGMEVVTLTDSLDAKWANVAVPMETGTRIATGNEPLLLCEGYVELLFDNRTRVTVEGPAEFQILTDDRVCLNYGKVYLKVPREAIGFSVYTQNAKIIDMGTEFGVLAELGGNTQLHVLKGKTMLMAGRDSKVNIEVSEGTAKKISDDIGEVSDIECRSDYFVREVNSESKFVWKGEKNISLADIAGGGNGFGTGKIDMGINPISGKPSTPTVNNKGAAPNVYHPVPSNPYVDGVFIPNGRTKQIISSRGHIFRECPVSSGDWYISFHNVMRKLDSQVMQDATVSDAPYVPCILQHANMGITFDLQAIRSLLPDINIVRFQSKFGIGSETNRPCNADFWILVDGEFRYKKTQVKEKKKFFSVDIELSDNDRFLTLVTTDGQDPEGRVFDDYVISTIDSDWCRFAEPVLVLE